MKIKTISRSEAETTRGTTAELHRVRKNADPKLHPFEKAREFARALRAVKLDRIFAKPFVGAMDAHADGVTCGATSPSSLVAYVSGAADGELIVWDLASQRALWSARAHAGFVRGLAVATDGRRFLSCGDDRSVKLWTMAAQEALAAGGDGALEDTAARVGARRNGAFAGSSSSSSSSSSMLEQRRGAGAGAGPSSSSSSFSSSSSSSSSASATAAPVAQWTGKKPFMGIDHNWRDALFATCAASVDVWDYTRSEPVHSYSWGAETVTSVRFNPADASLFASTANDRGVALYDLRADSPLRKVIMAMNANAVSWNPREPMNFAVASEDHNVYQFDMRRLDVALMVHKDHIGAVMDVHFSPTGREFATASYDRTVRIFRVDQARSREVYHTKRMQRVFTVRVTGDAKFVVSGSDDANVRIWKARASEPLARMMPRERAQMDYLGSLKRKFAHMPEVKRIAAQRNVPKLVAKTRVARLEEDQRARKKLANVRAHSRPGSGAGMPEAERKKAIVEVMK